MEAAVAGEEMVIKPLGGGQEVGRSCILLQYQSRNIMLDCGCHPGREGDDSLPFFDSLDPCNPEDIDLILITHFHIDHCAALPYFTERTDFKGKIFMTHPTKAVMKLLLSDNIRLQTKNQLYNEQDLQNCMDKIEVINYHQTVEYKGIKFTATAAGHVLGAAMFSIEIDGIRVLYTGDYSMEEDRHLAQAEVPPGGPPDVLIIESTFGTMSLDPREKREDRFTSAVDSIVSAGGSCLIPVFALGRAQELLLILENYWHQHPELQHVPIFYASKMATKSLKVYQTFVNMMNQSVRQLNDQFLNPFKLSHIKSIANPDMELYGPCVVMASPGFLQSGVSRQIFEAWCDDERHGVILAGYTVEGTLAHELLSDPREIRCLDNKVKPRRCRIEVVSFAAHVDYPHNRSFIRALQPDAIVLVHGEKRQMRALKDALDHEIRGATWPTRHKPVVVTPENGMATHFRFKKHIQASVEGALGSELVRRIDSQTQTAQSVQTLAQTTLQLPEQTLLVTENFTSTLVSAAELSSLTQCRLGAISERLSIPLPLEAAQLLTQLKLSRASTFVEEALQDIFEDVQVLALDELLVQQVVLVRLLCSAASPASSALSLVGLEVAWKASSLADFVADSAASLLMQLFSTAQLLKLSLSAPALSESAAPGPRGRRRVGQLVKGPARKKQRDQSADLHDVDPFHALPQHVPVPAAHSLAALHELVSQWSQAQPSPVFASIDITSDGTKLRFLGIPGTDYVANNGSDSVQLDASRGLDALPAEGFVYVVFRDEQRHDAVVSCEQDGFRRLIIRCLQSLSSLQ